MKEGAKNTTVHVKTDPKFEKWAENSFCPNALPPPDTWSSRPLLFRKAAYVHKIPSSVMSPAWYGIVLHPAPPNGFEKCSLSYCLLCRGRFEEVKEDKYLAFKKTCPGEACQGSLAINTNVFDFGGGRIIRENLPPNNRVGILQGQSHPAPAQRRHQEIFRGQEPQVQHADSGFSLKTFQCLERIIPYSNLKEFCHPVKSPGYLVTKAALAVFKTLSPSMEANIIAENNKEMIPNETYFMSPLAGTASVEILAVISSGLLRILCSGDPGHRREK
eukprot:620505-Amorphochlora_amoeboformis.AAC.1